MNVSRREVIASLCEGLKGDPSIYAMWLEGSDAHGLEDEYSDIDIWLDVDDGQAGEALDTIRSILSEIGPLDLDYEENHPHPQIRSAFFHIEGTPEFMALDVCVQVHSREIAFRKGYVDEKVKVLFDKSGVIRYEDVDWEAFERRLAVRTEEIRCALPLIQMRVRKEIARGNVLEALDYYYAMLRSLVELLRIKHAPTKHDFGLKHIRRDLPEDIVRRLEGLYAVSSMEDVRPKSEQAVEMLRSEAAT